MTGRVPLSAPGSGWVDALQEDLADGTFAGRVLDPVAGGPSPVRIDADGVHDLSGVFPTMRSITECGDPVSAVADTPGERLCSVEDLVENSWHRDSRRDIPRLLCPFDLHAVKAAGVTFVTSMIERVIEERALGDMASAAAVRGTLADLVDGTLASLRPGSADAAEVRRVLIAEGLWSQYLEVGIGPDAEIFTKSPVLASLGYGARVGILESSAWNNPEPEMVIAVSSTGRAIGASLGNDVNLRDIEGRSALLLPRAKDNNASSAIGPWIRLFDDGFRLDDAANATITLTVTGTDDFALEAQAHIAEISRSIPELVEQLIGRHHQYPDGAALFLGTPFAPVKDRDAVGAGFTHHIGDVVTIATPSIGALINEVDTSENCPPWRYGVHDFMIDLARRGLLASESNGVLHDAADVH